jgi:hypothetical protein
MCSTTSFPAPSAQDVSSPIFTKPFRSSTLLRADVVLRSSRVERSLRVVRDEESHGSRGDAAPPPRWIDPVGQLTVTLQAEACDHADKRAVLVDRTRSVLRVGSHALVVSLKRRPVRGVGRVKAAMLAATRSLSHRKRSLRSSSLSARRVIVTTVNL